MEHHVCIITFDGLCLYNCFMDDTAMKKDHGGNVGEISRIYGIDEDKIIDFSASINPLGYPPGLRAFESAANYLLVFMDSSTGLNSTELRDRLVPEGILTRDCSNFKGLMDCYFRIAVKANEQNTILIASLLREIR